MLADPKYKQKISSNPRGTAWSNDKNKFGQKVLEGMGWLPGKGLGSNLDGIVEHVKVSKKQNQSGVGYDPKIGDEWINHQNDFCDILQSLNQLHNKNECSDITSIDNKKDLKEQLKDVTSIEKKSKTSKRRVHYSKFTKSKDLSTKSHTDMTCVFGKSKKIDSMEKCETHEPIIDSTENTSTSSYDMKTYFAKKMLERKKKYEKL